jgi:hypothetical protein
MHLQWSMKSSVDQKVSSIFQELVGSRADELRAAIPKAQTVIAEALAKEREPSLARDIAFHLTDWHSDAAFIVAVLMFPERFTHKEIAEGVEGFIVHAPNHMAAAAKLGGYPVTDVFDIGALSGNEDA